MNEFKLQFKRIRVVMNDTRTAQKHTHTHTHGGVAGCKCRRVPTTHSYYFGHHLFTLLVGRDVLHFNSNLNHFSQLIDQ